MGMQSVFGLGQQSLFEQGSEAVRGEFPDLDDRPSEQTVCSNLSSLTVG
jgi:hypothetical protein